MHGERIPRSLWQDNIDLFKPVWSKMDTEFEDLSDDSDWFMD